MSDLVFRRNLLALSRSDQASERGSSTPSRSPVS